MQKSTEVDNSLYQRLLYFSNTLIELGLVYKVHVHVVLPLPWDENKVFLLALKIIEKLSELKTSNARIGHIPQQMEGHLKLSFNKKIVIIIFIQGRTRAVVKGHILRALACYLF